MSAHNLIIGSPYIDLGGKSIIKNLNKPHEYCELEYHKRGWSAGSYFKIDGEIYSGPKKEVVYTFEAKWNESATLINAKTNEKEIVWTKHPYPDQWEYMYGFPRFMIQLNYLPR